MPFQKEGATSHNAVGVRQDIEQMIPNCWMGSARPVFLASCFTRFSDLRQFLMVYLKDIVYSDFPTQYKT